MAYLERLFLGTMVAFMVIVVFFFGMYFDLYEMLAGGARASEPLLSAGEFAYTRAAMERVARPVEIVSRSYGNSDFHVPASAEELAQMYDFRRPRLPAREVVSWWRERLKGQGMPEGDLLEMEALGHDRESYGETMARVLPLMQSKDYVTASEFLEEAVRTADPRNLYVLRDLLARLVEAYHMMGEKAGAERAARQLSEVAEKILVIRAKCTSSTELTQAAAEVAQERQGTAKGIEDATKSELKARLLKAFEEGKISRAEMDGMLEQLK
ncbi:MAG: hypothetical protein HY814_04585 [Candidatus Riflebacteria bacterium]|nr:hypothetical protein [Candidatus Riflebacteria bacterium]